MASTDPNLAQVTAPNPLTHEHLATLNSVAQQIHATGLLIHKCKQCGIPVEKEEGDNAQQAQVVASIKQHFFPNHP